jgi:hypothetical protein
MIKKDILIREKDLYIPYKPFVLKLILENIVTSTHQRGINFGYYFRLSVRLLVA